MSDEHELLHDRTHPASGRLLSAIPVIKKPSQATVPTRREEGMTSLLEFALLSVLFTLLCMVLIYKGLNE
jgi:hypothetical protein